MPNTGQTREVYLKIILGKIHRSDDTSDFHTNAKMHFTFKVFEDILSGQKNH
jgi:hypothetical protein